MGKSAEIEARWEKMKSEGVVRSVPLVRQYKANAAPFYPPSKDAYKFRYSFTYKGSQEAPPPAPVIEASVDIGASVEVEASVDLVGTVVWRSMSTSAVVASR